MPSEEYSESPEGESMDTLQSIGHKHPSTGDSLAVRVDGEWFQHAAEYGSILVFWKGEYAENDPQVDVHEDGVYYSNHGQRPIELEKFVDEGGVTSYIAPSSCDIDGLEVHDTTVSEADFDD